MNYPILKFQLQLFQKIFNLIIFQKGLKIGDATKYEVSN